MMSIASAIEVFSVILSNKWGRTLFFLETLRSICPLLDIFVARLLNSKQLAKLLLVFRGGQDFSDILPHRFDIKELVVIHFMFGGFSNRRHHHLFHLPAVAWIRIFVRMLIFHRTYPDYKVTLLGILEFHPTLLLSLSRVCWLSGLEFRSASFLLFHDGFFISQLAVSSPLVVRMVSDQFFAMHKILSFVGELAVLVVISCVLGYIGLAECYFFILIDPVGLRGLIGLRVQRRWVFWIDACPVSRLLSCAVSEFSPPIQIFLLSLHLRFAFIGRLVARFGLLFIGPGRASDGSENIPLSRERVLHIVIINIEIEWEHIIPLKSNSQNDEEKSAMILPNFISSKLFIIPFSTIKYAYNHNYPVSNSLSNTNDSK